MTQDLNTLDLKGLLEAAEAQKRRYQADVEAAARTREQARLACEAQVVEQIGSLLPQALRPHLKFLQWTRPFFSMADSGPVEPRWDAELVIRIRNFAEIIVRCTTTPTFDPTRDNAPATLTAQLTGTVLPLEICRWELLDGQVKKREYDAEYFGDILSALSRAQEIGDERAALLAEAEQQEKTSYSPIDTSGFSVAVHMLNTAIEQTNLVQGPYETAVAAALTGLLALEMRKAFEAADS